MRALFLFLAEMKVRFLEDQQLQEMLDKAWDELLEVELKLQKLENYEQIILQYRSTIAIEVKNASRY